MDSIVMTSRQPRLRGTSPYSTYGEIRCCPGHDGYKGERRKNYAALVRRVYREEERKMSDANELYGLATGSIEPDKRVAHVRVMGRSQDIPLRVLDVSTDTPDAEIREAIASHLDMDSALFRSI